MKGTIEFQLPEEQTQHTCALSAHDLAANLSRVAAHIRSRLKYATLTQGQVAELEAVREVIDYELLERVGY